MSQVLIPAAALPGFPEASALDLKQVEGAAGLFSVTSQQMPQLRWFVLDTSMHVPHYAPSFSAEQLGLIGNPDPRALAVLAVVTTARRQPSVNLYAPLIVNMSSGQCLQALLDTQDWPLRYDLPQ
ncbi:flagellar assembly protein FliW [Glutamicibacter sp. MCAF14]|uniref:flagellar assembly protein FliW n=1 Tax=Glutamicibacter sp. MCAF14 TaxID=3233043 RepID=UPI003F8E6A8E